MKAKGGKTLLPDHEQILGALEGVGEGRTVKEVAVEVDLSEQLVRRGLVFLMKNGWVTRRKGVPSSPNMKPPYVYTKIDKEEEVPQMPSVNDAPGEEEELDQEQEPGERDQEQGEDRPGYQAPSLPGAQPKTKTTLGPSARGVMETMQKREVQEAEAHTAKAVGHATGGTRRIERIDPIPAGFPEEEKGMLGHPVELTIVGDINDYISETYGGGSYLVHPCDHTGEVYGGRPMRVSIAGVPKPQTDEGRVWLEDRKTRLAKASGGDKNGGTMDQMALMQYMDRQTKEARRESEESTNRLLAIFKPTGPDPKELENLRTQHQTYIEGLKTSHTSEMTLVRSDAERRVQDATRAFEAQVVTLKEQIVALRQELKEAREKATADLKEIRNDLDRQHDKAITELKERQTAQIAAIEKSTTEKIQWLEKMGKLESEMAINKAKPVDFQTKVQSHMAEDIAKIAIAEARKAAGLGEESEGPETMMDALKEAVVEAGPDVLKRVASGIMSIVESRQGVAKPPTALPPQRPGLPAPKRPGTFLPRPGAKPAPVPPPAPGGRAASQLLRERGPVGAPPAPPPPMPVILTEEQQANLLLNPPPAQVHEPTIEETLTEDQPIEAEVVPQESQDEAPAATPAQQAMALRLQTFFEVLFTEMQIDSEASEVWVQPIPGTDMSFEDLYYKLPGAARRAMEAAPPAEAFQATLTALGVTAADDPLLSSIQELVDAKPEAKQWMTDFFDAGPWNEPEEDEDEEDEDEEDEDEEEEEEDETPPTPTPTPPAPTA